MSRTRIVKGKITERVKGDISIYSASNIIETSLQSIIETGKEKGISFGQPSKPPEYQPENTIILYIGMFFDGTGNNRFNSESLYYTKVKGNNDRIKSSEIPTQLSFTHTPEKIKEKDISKINISNRDSYWNPYSNIVKLHDLYKEKSETDLRTKKNKYTLKQYVEGIGTEKYKKDSVVGSSVGRGDTGIIAKVERGIKDLVKEKIAALPKDKKIYKIVFDVFGFSRGAAAARHFCNEVKKPAYYVTRTKRDPYEREARILTDEKDLVKHAGGILGAELNKIGLKPYEETYNNIEIRFLGLFDTVVSDLIVKENLGYIAALFTTKPWIPILEQERLEDIKTNISGLGIKKVFQIRANDEWRANFAYTPTEEGHTLYMLGAHSDIGGGYAELDKYTSILGFFDATKGDEEMFKQQEKVRKYFIDGDYCKENEIWFEKIYEHTSGFSIESSPTETTTIYKKKISDHYILKTSRYISNKYSLVPMYVMLQKAIDNGVPFYKNYEEAADDDADVKNPFEHEIPDTEEFKMLREYLKEMLKVSKEKKEDEDKDKDKDKNKDKKENHKIYSLSAEMFKHIRNRYVHLSSHYAGLDTLWHRDGDHHFLGDLLFINRPVRYKEDENGKIFYEREIYK